MKDIQDVNGPCCMKVSQYSTKNTWRFHIFLQWLHEGFTLFYKDYMKVSHFSTMVTWRFHIFLQRLHEGFTFFYKTYMKVSHFSTMVTWRFHIFLQWLHEGFTLFYKDYKWLFKISVLHCLFVCVCILLHIKFRNVFVRTDKYISVWIRFLQTKIGIWCAIQSRL